MGMDEAGDRRPGPEVQGDYVFAGGRADLRGNLRRTDGLLVLRRAGERSARFGGPAAGHDLWRLVRRPDRGRLRGAPSGSRVFPGARVGDTAVMDAGSPRAVLPEGAAPADAA